VCALAILAASAAWLLLISRYYQWFGGGSWGPRFLVPLLPLWILPAAEIFSRWRLGRAWRLAIVVLVAASLLVSVAPMLVPFSDVDAPLAWSESELTAGGWRLRESPLLQAVALLPRAAATTASKLLGRSALGEAGRPPSGPRYPDFAFEHYGSHSLLVWTRGCFAVAALALCWAFAVARRARDGDSPTQKALLSRPPQ
jgi:MFS family permease